MGWYDKNDELSKIWQNQIKLVASGSTARNTVQWIASCKLNIWTIRQDETNDGNIPTLFQSHCQT